MFTLYGQLMLKWRITIYGSMPESLPLKAVFLAKLLLDPIIISCFLSAFIASLFWMAAMTKFEVSYAYPIINAGLLILTVILSVILLKESITFPKILGVFLISAGLVAMTADA